MEKPQLALALIGFGVMGKTVFEQATAKHKKVVSTIDPHAPAADFKEISPANLRGAKVAICFTRPEAVLENVEQLLAAKVKIVMATTGWQKDASKVKKLVEEHNGAFLYSANYSIGVNLFFALVQQATQLLGPFHDYSPYLYEIHHKRKLDSPSGTALHLAEIVVENHPIKKKIVHQNPVGALKEDELHLASIRGGEEPGEHRLVFDAAFDSIELKHTARSRAGFAAGALVAAEWLADKQGYFTDADWLGLDQLLRPQR